MNQPTSTPAPSAAPTPPTTTRFEDGELDWIEKAALENLKQRITTADTIAKEAKETLTVLLALAGGSWAYSIKLLDESATRAMLAALLSGVWFTFLAMALVVLCMLVVKIPITYNEPAGLLQRQKHSATYEDWREGELENIQSRIDDAKKRNNKIASRLNWIRAGAAAAPLLVGAALSLLLYLQR